MSDELVSTPNLVGSIDSGEPADEGSWAVDEAEEGDEPEAKEPAKPAPEAKPEPKKPNFKKVKINDREEMVDEDELVRSYSKTKAGEDKFREAAELKKQADQFLEAFKADPLKVLSDAKIPFNRKELAEKWLLAELERDMADPRDLALQERDAELKGYKDKEAAIEQDRKDAEHEVKREAKRSEISQMFTKALEATPLSKDPQVAASAMRDMALYLRTAKDRGLDVSPDELAAHVNDKYYKGMRALAGQLDGNDLIEFLGKDVLAKIRKSDLSALKSREPAPQTHKNEEWVQERSKVAKRMDPYEAREMVKRKLGM